MPMTQTDAEEDAVPEDMTSFGAAVDAWRKVAGIRRPGTGRRSRMAAIAGALRDIADHAAEKGLRQHQEEAVEAVAAQFARSQERGATTKPLALVVIPTGGGKTRAFQTVVSALGRDLGPGRRSAPTAVVLVPTRVLLRQTWIEFQTNFPNVDVACASPTKMFDDDGNPIPAGARSTTLMTYAAFMKAAEKGVISPDDVDLLVMDEAHRGLSDVRQTTLKRFLDRCAVSAWTATPAFDEEKNVQNLLGDGNEVYRVDPQTLRDRDVIAPIVNYVMAVGLKGEEPSDPRLMLRIRREALVECVLDFVQHHVEPQEGRPGIPLAGKVAIFYGADRSQAGMFVEAYNRRLGRHGKRMVLLTGDDSAAHIQETIARVRSGEISALANSMLLVEGFDVPKVGLVVNSPCGSMLKILQQAGRMQRMDPDLPVRHPDQLSFVLDTYYRVNGRIVGRPRFVFEALSDNAVARTVEPRTRSIEEMARNRDLDGAETAAVAGEPEFEISSDLETVFYMLRQRDDRRGREGRPPKKEPGMMSLYDILTEARTDSEGRERLTKAFEDLESAWTGSGVATLDDAVVAGGIREQNGSNPVFCIPEADAARLAASCNAPFVPHRPMRRGDLTADALAARLKIEGGPLYRQMWRDIDAALRSNRKFEIADGPLEVHLVKDGRKRYPVVRSADVERIGRHLGMSRYSDRPAPEGYLGPQDVALIAGLDGKACDLAWLVFADALTNDEMDGIRVAWRANGEGGFDLFVHRDQVKSFVARFVEHEAPKIAPLRRRPGIYLARREALAGLPGYEAYGRWRRMEHAADEGTLHGLRVRRVEREFGRVQYLLHADDVDEFAAMFPEPGRKRAPRPQPALEDEDVDDFELRARGIF